jgi:hypothetical protein
LPFFASLHGLISLACEHGIDVNPTLLRVLTDLYVQTPTHPPEEERQFTEFALRLIETADAETVAIVARKLIAYPATPAAVMARIAQAGLARTETATGEAAQTGDAGACRFSGVDFLSAKPDERRRILSEIPAAAPGAALPRDVAAAVRQLETCALTGKPSEFTRVLARALRISETVALRIVNDRSGEPLLVAAKALAMPRDVFQRILLFVNPAVGHSVRRVYDLSDLYGEVTVKQALHLVGLWRTDDPASVRSPRHQSYSWNDERLRAREAVTPSQTSAPADRAAIPNRRYRTT